MGISRTTLACGVVLMFAIAVLCPAARGDALALFTTTVTSNDVWNGEVPYGPKLGEANVITAYSGDAYLPEFGTTMTYANEVRTASTFAFKLLPSGEVKVGNLNSTGWLEGPDTLSVAGEVTFSMTINATPDAPLGARFPILFLPTLGVVCDNEPVTFEGATATPGCDAFAAASITDNATGISQSQSLPISGTGQNYKYPVFQLNTYVGDTFTIDLTTSVFMSGSGFICGTPGNYSACGPLVGAEATAGVDPLFEFDQQAFTGSYILSDYYKFSFSPNISTVPEPSSLLLLGTGLVGICLAALRKK